MYCGNCGKIVGEHDRHCGSCGVATDAQPGKEAAATSGKGNTRAVLITVLVLGLIAAGLFAPYLHNLTTETQSISFSTDTTQDGSLELGDSNITQQGKDGERLVTN